MNVRELMNTIYEGEGTEDLEVPVRIETAQEHYILTAVRWESGEALVLTGSGPEELGVGQPGLRVVE